MSRGLARPASDLWRCFRPHRIAPAAFPAQGQAPRAALGMEEPEEVVPSESRRRSGREGPRAARPRPRVGPIRAQAWSAAAALGPELRLRPGEGLRKRGKGEEREGRQRGKGCLSLFFCLNKHSMSFSKAERVFTAL